MKCSFNFRLSIKVHSFLALIFSNHINSLFFFSLKKKKKRNTKRCGISHWTEANSISIEVMAFLHANIMILHDIPGTDACPVFLVGEAADWRGDITTICKSTRRLMLLR